MNTDMNGDALFPQGPSGGSRQPDMNSLGVELLINPRKRAPSDADSIISALSAGGSSYRPPAAGGFDHFPTSKPSTRASSVRSVQVRPMAAAPSIQGSVDGSEASSPYDSGEEETGEEETEDGDGNMNVRTGPYMDPRARQEAEAREKRDVLYQLERLQRKGVRMAQAFSMSSSLEEMRAELERLKTDREMDASIRFQRRMLMACVTGVEFMNTRFDPFDVKLEGWSDSINENIDDYDEVFEDLYSKYRGKAKMAPEIKLMFMVGGSAVMFHLTNSVMKSLPGMDHVLRQNPEIASQIARAMMSSTQAQPAATAPPQSAGGGGAGLLGSLFGSLFGGGSSSAAPEQRPVFAPPTPTGSSSAQFYQPRPVPSTQQHMRGPVAVDDILSELQQNAFPQHASANNNNARMQAPAMSAARSNRIEVVSNASGDSNFSDLLSTEDIMAAQPTRSVRGGRGGRVGTAAGRGGRRGTAGI